jgi:hypothetical protein
MTSSLLSPGQISPAQAAAELLRRRRARANLLDFTLYTKPDYEAGWHHRLLAGTLDRFAAGLIPRLVVCIPPQHGKTELVVRRLAAKLLGDDPDLRIISCSYSASLASDGNRDVQRIIDDEPYRRLYPGTALAGRNVRTVAGPMPLRNSDVFEVAGRRGFYRSAGVGGPITGKPMDVGIIDDPFKNREEADSPVVRESVWQWYTGAFLSRAHKGTRILVCHTRWHPEDLVGRLLKQQQDDPKASRWEVLVLPAVCKADGDGCGSPRRAGEALWPERHPLTLLEQKKAANPYDWWSLYQQEPRNPGSTEWPESYFTWPGFWFEDWPTSGLVIKVMALDPSKGTDSKTGDYQALVKFARDEKGVEYVEADLAKRPLTALKAADGTELSEGMVETAVDQAAAFRPEGVAVETNLFQVLLLIPFRDVAESRGYEVPLYGLDNTVKKEVRIRRLGTPLSQRRTRFRRTPGTRLLVEQLKQFPTADHDDGPDALEMARRLAVELYNGKEGTR